MLKILFISSQLIGLLFLNMFYAPKEVKLDHDLPTSTIIGAEHWVYVTIDKGRLGGFAKLQVDVPEGMQVEPGDLRGASFTFAEGAAKIIWMSLPSDNEFEISYKLIIYDDCKTGNNTVKQKFAYLEKNERKVLEVDDHVMFVDSENLSNEYVPDTLANGLRTITKLNADHYLVELDLYKDGIKGFAKVEEYIPAGMNAEAVNKARSVFTQIDDKVKFVWFSIPEEERITLTYELFSDGPLDESLLVDGKLPVSGEFTYLRNNESRTIAMETDLNPGILEYVDGETDIPDTSELALETPDVEINPVDIPDLTVETPDVEIDPIDTPDLTVETPDVEIDPVDIPDLTVETPDMEIDPIDTPDLTVETPDVEIDPIDIPDLTVETPDAEIAPVDIPDLIVETPDVEIDPVDIPDLTVETPDVEIDPIDTPDLTVKTPVLEVDPIDTPDLTVETPDIEIDPIDTPDLTVETPDVEIDPIDTPDLTVETPNVEINPIETPDLIVETPDVEPIIEDYEAVAETTFVAIDEQAEHYENVSSIPSPDKGVSYRVQIMAGKNVVGEDYLKKRHRFSDDFTIEHHAVWVKYTTGIFNAYKEARDKRNHITDNYNFDGPFVTAYNDGSRISVQEALMISSQKWYQ